LAGITWKVEETNVFSDMGHCDYQASVIRLRSDLSDQVKQATFCHELVHSIMFTTGLLNHDEREVDAMGHLLHQFLVTQK
jgi:hypothetical protein